MRLAFTAAVARALLVDGLAIVVVLEREVLAPDRRIVRRVVERDDSIEGIPRLLLPLEHAGEERGDAHGGECAAKGGEDEPAEAEPTAPEWLGGTGGIGVLGHRTQCPT